MNSNGRTQIKSLKIVSEEEREWSWLTLDKFIPNLFPKIVSLNTRYTFLIGGTIIPEFGNPPIKEPQNSIFLVDMLLERVIFSKKLSTYRVHSACILDQTDIYILGGQLI
jgi:hypothetical protein